MRTEILCVKKQLLIVVLFVTTFIPFTSFSAELFLVHTINKDDLVIEAKLDKVKKLAGMKLSIEYSKDHLLLKESEKSKSLGGFMHVVNDKVPGKLIAVVASATGISATDLQLFKFTFTKRKGATAQPLLFKPLACELMSDTLKSIPCDFSTLTVH